MRPFLLSSFLAIGCLNLALPVQAQTGEASQSQTQATGARASAKSGGSVTVSNGTYSKGGKGETVYITTDDNGLKLQVIVRGTVTVGEDERSVTSLGEGGYFEFARREKGAPEHKVELENKAGTLQARYWVGGKEQDYATAGKAWLAQHLPELVSRTGLGAEARAERLYQEGGARNVLAHTATLEPGTGRTKMYHHLLQKPGLSADDAAVLLEQIAQKKGTDHDAVKSMTQVPISLLAHARTAEAYAQASAALVSDYEKGRALKHLLQQEELPEKALDQTAAAIKGMHSNYEKVKVLSALTARPTLSGQQFDLALEALESVSSDYERAKGLGSLLRHEQQVAQSFDKVLPLITGIGSDYEKTKAYTSLLGNTRLGTSQYLPLLKASEGIGSDYEKAKLLRKMAPRLPKDNEKVKEAYARAAKTVGSAYEYEKVIAAYQ
ncbi:hypothetical protein [Rufibacter psychrotolerans]|uniref:hypothetical protein n=1 Tax=Rufibacter psychrotolerans TaxID=2812556 RepID=UPI00196858D4|nr:hypothetical protein [Rufibacter sp. SYSU D00308]